MPYIDVRIEFDPVMEADEVIYYTAVSVRRTGTDIPATDMLGIGEVLGQSDRWNVGGVSAVLDAMVGDDDTPRQIKEFY